MPYQRELNLTVKFGIVKNGKKKTLIDTDEWFTKRKYDQLQNIIKEQKQNEIFENQCWITVEQVYEARWDE